MKKLIAILVVFALAMGAAFAEASVSGAVFGTVSLFGSDTSEDAEITGGMGLDRVRLEASGGDDEGTFGSWMRWDGRHWSGNPVIEGNVWWKPIDQFRLLIGGNSDGMYGKEGVTGWAFHQTPTDTGVAINGDNVWGGSHYSKAAGDGKAALIKALRAESLADYLSTNSIANEAAMTQAQKDAFDAAWKTELDLYTALGFFRLYDGTGYQFREIFYGGFGAEGLMLEIKPIDMLGINIVLPYSQGGLVEDIFGNLMIQFDLNLDFGNIALTYTGDASDATNGKMFLYAGIPIGDTVNLDVGLSMQLPGDAKDFPINIGAGVKVAISETFGLKARLGARIPMGDDVVTIILADVLPYFAINDVMTVFIGLGLGLVDVDANKQFIGFHFNPYLQVGSEWGPKFLAGLKVVQGYADGGDSMYGGDSVVSWSVPIALQCSF